MLKQTIDILTSQKNEKKVCEMGNVAIARGAIESGVCGVFSYPGTPSTEISEVFRFVNDFQNKKENEQNYPQQTKNKIYFEYSINEKIALEKAIAFSIGNKSALCVMKNVGMNVASDPLMSVTYQTIIAPLVIVICDDPGCHSSSNEQDSRYWGPMASVPVFNPATPEDALKMTKQAFELSGQLKLPVVVRTTTRVSHSRGVVNYGKIESRIKDAKFDRLPEHINIPARTAAAHTRLLDKLKSEKISSLLKYNSKKIIRGRKPRLGIISSGVSTAYATEIIYGNNILGKVKLLDLGLIHPFPEKEVFHFLKSGIKKVLILEELDPFVESAVRNIAQKKNLNIPILGKGFSGLQETGEFTVDLISKVLEVFSVISFSKNRNVPINNTEQFLDLLPPRPPTLCAGCPHRATYYLLKLAIPREQSELIMCGDIGCFGLGALPPLKMIDTINHMGMSISMAQGLYESFHTSDKGKKVVALLGDGTFFHSGLTSLVNAIYTKANILVIIFDNRTIGMTGQQPHPGASNVSKYHELDISQVVKGLGVEVVESINPFNIRESFEKVDKAMNYQGVSVVVSKAPCVFLPDFKEKIDKKLRIVVDPDLCNSCANHEDHSLACSRCYMPKNNLSRAKAKLLSRFSIPGKSQECPSNICNHGFFNSIVEGDYKSAVEIVRDKMLFARTCGDICHRPCELFSKEKKIIPIKELKHFVSAQDDNFKDFSLPIKRAKTSKKKDKKIAVIGAGPSGLSAAYDLIQWGYDVTVFEKENKAGGMITYAIPDFRMDKKGFDFEAMQLEKMGVKFHFGKTLGKDFSLEELSDEFDSVIIAIGLNKAKTLGIIERTIPKNKQTDAITFLRLYNTKDKNLLSENVLTVLIIGGGNSAIDTARAAKRLYQENTVIVSCIESENSMPAFTEEIEHAKNEGVLFIPDSYVNDVCVAKNGQIKITLLSFNDKKYLQEIKCDHVITAIGQTTEPEIIHEISRDANQRITNKDNFTNYKNIFVSGDICAGNNISVIGAIASGKKAATGVRKLLENYTYEYEGEDALQQLNKNMFPVINSSATSGNRLTYEEGRIKVLPTGDELSEVFNLFQSCYKCNHCIDNFGCPAMVKVNGKVQIDMNRCNLCGLCIDVCPNNAIRFEEKILSS